MANMFDQYTLGTAQAHRSARPLDDQATPTNKLATGIDSAGTFIAAPFLPVVRYTEEFRSWVVIPSNKPVSIATDAKGNEWLVPAGFELILENSDETLKYTAEDVRAGIKNAQGNLVAVGEAVVTSLKAANIKISPFVGIINQNILLHHPMPHGGSFCMDYVYEYPMVKDAAEYAKARLPGVAAFVGDKALAGQFITYDKDSNFVLTHATDFDYGTTKQTRVIGQVLKVYKIFDPENGKATGKGYHLLDHVTNAVTHLGNTDNMPGVNTKGLTSKVHLANGYGVIQFSLQTR